MAVALKRKRKIIVNGQLFYWYVSDCEEGTSTCLHVLSPDKKFLIAYSLNQSESYKLGWSKEWQQPFVAVKGGGFGGLPSFW